MAIILTVQAVIHRHGLCFAAAHLLMESRLIATAPIPSTAAIAFPKEASAEQAVTATGIAPSVARISPIAIINGIVSAIVAVSTSAAISRG